jgi:hypothetical protein
MGKVAAAAATLALSVGLAAASAFAAEKIVVFVNVDPCLT